MMSQYPTIYTIFIRNMVTLLKKMVGIEMTETEFNMYLHHRMPLLRNYCDDPMKYITGNREHDMKVLKKHLTEIIFLRNIIVMRQNYLEAKSYYDTNSVNKLDVLEVLLKLTNNTILRMLYTIDYIETQQHTSSPFYIDCIIEPSFNDYYTTISTLSTI